MEPNQIIIYTELRKGWIDYLSALLTPTIAILGSFIAFQQWRTNRARLKNELFDRRYEQFSAVMNFLGSIITFGKCKIEEQQKFLAGTRGMRFIFDEEISTYIDENIWKLAIELEQLDAELEGVPVGEERTKNAKRQAEIKKQLYAELSGLNDRFAPYLQLKH